MVKKTMVMVLALMLACMLTAVCSAEAGHTHAPSEGWGSDVQEHWQVCECGEKIGNAEEHSMDDMTCTVCGSEIWVYEEGGADVSAYNEYGDPVRYTSYDAEGVVMDDYRYEYEYDAEGNLLWGKTYYGGALIEESSYAVSMYGERLTVKQTAYYDDDTWAVNEYDEYGNQVKSSTYAADGTVTDEEITEYIYGEEGEILGTKQTRRFEDGTYHVYEHNEYGDQIFGCFYNADGSVDTEFRSEYEYDENGNMLRDKSYVDGILSDETVYVVLEDEEGSWSCEQMNIWYQEDGSRQIIEYNEHGDVILEKECDADGETVSEIRYEYEYDDEGNVLSCRAYENDRLVMETVGAVLEDEFSFMYYTQSITEYYEDGGKMVCEYDENSDLIRETEYDADGEITSEIRYEYEYDADENLLWDKTYENGVLTMETVYAMAEDEGGYLHYVQSITEYSADGTKVVYEYDESGELVKETAYDADGKEVE